MEKAFVLPESKIAINGNSTPDAIPARASRTLEPPTVFGRPREFLGNRFVYAVISQRAYGLSIGINLNPDKLCNFNCAYCEVNRDLPPRDTKVDLGVMSKELDELLAMTYQERLRELPYFRTVPKELLALREVALSGDGEPTLSPQFGEIMREVVFIRSRGKFPFFKLVLITNTSGFDLPEVRRALKLLTSRDEIWAKFEAGTQEYMDRVNRANLSLQKVLANILLVARERPVIIQSLFPLLQGEEPSTQEIELYAQHLLSLKNNGAQISQVQVYSAHRPPHHPNCTHLKLKSLARIAQRVLEVTGIRAEVF